MNKYAAIVSLKQNGDSTITFNDSSGIVATTDFSTPYIRRKKHGRYEIQKNCILVFSWTDDKFINIPISKIKNIKPLSQTLGNVNNA